MPAERSYRAEPGNPDLVFFPVVYVPGIAGAFFRDQALTVTFSILVSVGAALLLQPVLSARILKVSGNLAIALRAMLHSPSSQHQAAIESTAIVKIEPVINP